MSLVKVPAALPTKLRLRARVPKGLRHHRQYALHHSQTFATLIFLNSLIFKTITKATASCRFWWRVGGWWRKCWLWWCVLPSEVLEVLVSTSNWPRNEAKFLASSCPRPRKTRIKSLVLKMAEKKAKIPRNSLSCPWKGQGKGKIPRLV